MFKAVPDKPMPVAQEVDQIGMLGSVIQPPYLLKDDGSVMGKFEIACQNQDKVFTLSSCLLHNFKKACNLPEGIADVFSQPR